MLLFCAFVPGCSAWLDALDNGIGEDITGGSNSRARVRNSNSSSRSIPPRSVRSRSGARYDEDSSSYDSTAEYSDDDSDADSDAERGEFFDDTDSRSRVLGTPKGSARERPVPASADPLSQRRAAVSSGMVALSEMLYFH